MGRARDVARPTCASAGSVERLMHRGQDLGVLPHAQIVIRTPNRHLRWAIVALGLGKRALLPLQLGKVAVIALCLEIVQR